MARTTIGWTIPRSRIEVASCESSSSAKFLRGLRGFGRKNSTGTRRWSARLLDDPDFVTHISD